MRRTLEWNAFESFDEATRDDSLFVTREGEVRLVDRLVLADEMGRCNHRDVEVIEGLTWVRKIFHIVDPGSSGGTLGLHLSSVEDEDQAFLVQVNDHEQEVVFPPRAQREYWELSWRRVGIPRGVLRKGDNDVIVRAKEGSRLNLRLENCVQPNRSAKSRDGGRTWDFDHLGYNDAYDGEYLIRLELNAHPSSGVITSPPIDLATAFSGKDVGARVSLAQIGIRASSDKPKGTGVQLQLRIGNEPDPNAATWGPWKLAKEFAETEFIDACYIQWRATLTTKNADVTPSLRSVKLILNGEVEKRAGTNVRIISSENPTCLRSSHRFAWQRADDDRSNILRKRWDLDKVVAPAKTEFEKFLLLRQWVRDQWEDGWNRGPLQFVPPWDTLLILELTSRQLSLGMCTHYATVMTHCCMALGLPARTVILNSHCINEIWSNELQKWIAMDVGGDCNDFRKTTYHFERNGVPLSFLEIHYAWVNQDFEGVRFDSDEAYAAFKLEARLKLFDRFMVHMRNDELTSLEPGEPEHGAGSYQYDRYLHWADEKTPPLPWFSKSTRRAADIFWPINKTHIYVREAADECAMEIQLDHCTPNFSHFELNLNGGEFEKCPSLSVRKFSPGTYSIAARTVDTFGNSGIESVVQVKVKGAAKAAAKLREAGLQVS
ncbi:MAG: transglutaminase-like domain-containing protein [Planctomycetota bacterium]|nr:transglutaminase-like domain-containing protein [Planctomycetota bacterium]